MAAPKGGVGLALRVWVNKRQHLGRRGGESIANALGRAGY